MRYALLFALAGGLCTVSSAADWLTLPSTYSHDVASCQRVSQFAPIKPPTAVTAPNFRSSGFTNTRSSLNYGGSADNYHRVEKWGEEVRPYGEWRFPYRPYSVPYSQWGPPFAGFNSGFGGYGGPGFGSGYQSPGFGGPKNRPRRPPGGDEADAIDDDYIDFPHDRNDGFRRRRPRQIPQASPFNPYPAGPGSPYPVAPYYDGFYPQYRR